MRQLLMRWLAIGAAAMAPAAAFGDENWSRFRGPNGAGVAEGVSFPVAWTRDDYAWRVELPGEGHSSPIGWEGRIFVTTGDVEAGVITLLALDAATGRKLWDRQFESPGYRMHLSNSLASSTPAADERHVYLAWASPEALQVAAVSHEGDEVWRRDLGPVDFKHGFGASPIVVGDLVVMPCDHGGDSFVAALDASSGEVRWRTPRRAGTEAYATPCVVDVPGNSPQIIVNSSAEGMTALSPRDGRPVWQLPDVFKSRCVGSPLVADGLIVGTGGQGGGGRDFAVVGPAAPGEEARVLHQRKTSIPQVVTPVAHRGLLFIWTDGGVVTCCDLQTGDVKWTKRVGGRFAGSPVIAGDKLYAVSVEGEVVVLAASEEFAELGRSDLGESSQATPAIHGGRMYLRTETSLACLPSDS